LPLALPDPVTVIHDAGLETLHAQPDPVVTEIVPVPPAAARLSDAGVTRKVQPLAACVTVKPLPAIVRAAERDEVVAFAAIVKPTPPSPLPVAPLVIVTHEAGLVAVHAHPAGAVTETLAVPPVAATDWLVEEIV
jgi:hypothetical protein